VLHIDLYVGTYMGMF